MHHLKSRTPAGLAAYLVIASTAAFGGVLAGQGQSAHAAGAGHAAGPVQAPRAAAGAAASKPRTAAPVRAAARTKAAKPAEAAVPAQRSYPDNLNGWIAEARAVLAADGDRTPSADSIRARAMTESSGNPRAENHWDSNQALYGGTYGLIQTIKPTFASYSLPGHRDILDPVDSIIAGVRYANDRYGSFETIAYGKQGY